jgi:ABC-type polysaccharide/polyol phosphate transport system ATPase subunit
MGDILIKARNIQFSVPSYSSDKREILADPLSLIKGLYSNRSKRKPKLLLNDISFELKEGQKLALIGPNGAGKTTLIRLLSGAYKISGGELTVNGVTRGLYNINAGFKEKATGLENIYLRLLSMSVSISDISEMIQPIIEFSELGDQIYDSIGTYSTGMRLRLAFSIETSMPCDILIMDEWIGAGDAGFQAKARMRMNDYLHSARGLIIASHNVKILEGLCTHGLFLMDGKVKFYGKMSDALDIMNESCHC